MEGCIVGKTWRRPKIEKWRDVKGKKEGKKVWRILREDKNCDYERDVEKGGEGDVDRER